MGSYLCADYSLSLVGKRHCGDDGESCRLETMAFWFYLAHWVGCDMLKSHGGLPSVISKLVGGKHWGREGENALSEGEHVIFP